MSVVAEMSLVEDASVVAVRRAARLIAEAVGLSTQDQTRLAAAASELAREARERGAGPLRFRVGQRSVRIEVDQMGAAQLAAARMVDRVFAADDRFVLEKSFPGQPPAKAAIEELRMRLLTADPRAAAEEIRRQNAELLVALEEQRSAEEALRRSEERLRQAIVATRLGTWQTGDRWVLSERAQEIFGVDDGLDPFATLDAETRARVEEALRALREKGQPLELEVELRPEVWVVLRALMEGDWVVGTVLDVSARRKREEEARIRAELEKLLVGVVSHDLRSPLGTLKMGIHMLEDAQLNETQQAVLQRMGSAVGTASQLVADLLDFTRARLGGGIPISPTMHEGHALVTEVIDDMRLANPNRSIARVSEGPGQALVDGERLKQVVTNLLANAIRHSPADTEVRVETRGTSELFLLRVHNWGDVIPPEAQAQIFEPLKQSSHASGRKGSLGLGLFIVKHIAEAHGGAVTVTSSEEEGTTFELSLPRG